jgi:hypothetical protein
MGDGEYPRLTAQELAAAGQALYGSGWRVALAHALGVSRTDIVKVESGREVAPEGWRAKVVALAQDMALRALDAASTLLWRDGDLAEPSAEPLYAPIPRLI